MIAIHDLPAINAFLNGTAGLLLIWGYVLIRQRKIEQHRKVMLAAFATSILFLICYLIYHANIGSKHYTGPVPALYFTILITHTILAACVPVLAIITLRRGLAMNIAKHRKIAKWTLPIWLYVSVTGVVVYLMLYQL